MSNYNDKPNSNVVNKTGSSSKNDYEKSFTEKDSEQFESFLNRYIQYKQTKRPDGIVSKQDSDLKVKRFA